MIGGVQMAIFFTAVEKMITLFLYIVVGYILRKKELISDGFTNGIVKVLMLVGMPAMVLNTFQTDISPETVKVGLNVFLLTCVAYGISYIVGFATAKLFKIELSVTGIWIFSVMFPNHGFMGWPVIQALYGQEGMFLAVFGNLGFQIFSFTVGVLVISKYANSGKANISLRKLLITPVNISMLLGIILFMTGKRLPSAVNGTLSGLGGLVTPLAMIYIGAILTKNKFRDMFNDYRVYIVSAIRLIVIPVVLAFVLKPFVATELALAVIVIGQGMSVASYCTMFTAEYGGDVLLSSKFVFVSTLLGMITIPLITMLV